MREEGNAEEEEKVAERKEKHALFFFHFVSSPSAEYSTLCLSSIPYFRPGLTLGLLLDSHFHCNVIECCQLSFPIGLMLFKLAPHIIS